MKLLFLSYHFPGPLSPLTKWLAERGHGILFASNRAPALQKPMVDGIQRVILKRFPASSRKESRLDNLENGLRAARYAEKSFLAIKESGFNPEIIITASSGGAALALSSVFPDAYWVNFLEPSFSHESLVKESLVQNLQISLAQSTQAFFYSQRNVFPEIIRPAIHIFTPCVDSNWYRPDNINREQNLAVFFNLRNPEKLIKSYLAASVKNRAIFLAGSTQVQRNFSPSSFPPERFQLSIVNNPEETREIFRMASLSFFEFPGDLALQAMSCECPGFASMNIAKEDLPIGIIQLSPAGKRISNLFDNPDFLVDYGKNCRKLILEHHDLDKIMPDWFEKTCANAKLWQKGKYC